MILLKLEGEAVVEFVVVDNGYTPKENEVLVETLPSVEVVGDQRAYLYFKNNKVEFIIKEKGEY